jgi:hypothetical protein
VKPRIHVQVEPLAEPRWARIRHEIYGRIAADADASGPVAARQSPFRRDGASTKAHAPSWRMWTAAAAVVFAVTTASLAYRSVTARGGGRLADPSRIATGAAASHVVLDGLTLDVAAESAVVVSGDATRGILVVLDRGSVTLDVEPRAARAGFVVQAGEVRVRVVGTRFGVSRWMDRASVQVERGVVEVDASGRTVQVHAGETWRSADSAETVGTPSASGAAVAAEAQSPRAPVDATPPEHAEHGRIRRHASEAPVGASRTTEKAAASAKPDPPAPKPMPAQQPASQQLYEAAAQLEVSDPARAIALYRQVVARGDSWLADALFAQGRLEAERGAHAQARATLTEYLARFPRGSNADDARLLLERTR